MRGGYSLFQRFPFEIGLPRKWFDVNIKQGLSSDHPPMCHIVPGVFQPNRKHNSVQLWHTLPQTLKFTPHTSISEYS